MVELTAGEDTTAQLREQMVEATGFGDRRFATRVVDDLLPIVAAQVEAAKATARRDAQVATLHDVRRVIAESDTLRTKSQIVEWLGHQSQGAEGLRARASAQGAAAPTAVSEHEHDSEWCKHGGKWACQSCLDASRGAQSSGHEFVGGEGTLCWETAGFRYRCGKPADALIHQRVPGQPGEQDTPEETTP